MQSKDINIAVIIRTYSRISDTEALIHLITNHWKHYNYSIFIIHNGEQDGHIATEAVKNAGTYISLTENHGHINGAKSLVQEGFSIVQNHPEFTHYLFIESDFWLLNDDLIKSCVENMQQKHKEIATTVWVEKIRSLAVDFFLISADFIKKNPQILDWNNHPEQYFGQIVSSLNIYIIPELRPVHLPKILRIFHLPITLVDEGRFRIFPKAPAVTHHIETLAANRNLGITIKKGIANALAKKEIFANTTQTTLPKPLFLQQFSRFIPQSAWFNFFRKINRKPKIN